MAALIDRSSDHLNAFLRSIGLGTSVRVEAELFHREWIDRKGVRRPIDTVVAFDRDSPTMWPADHHYMWFMVPPAPGGTAARIATVDPDLWEQDFAHPDHDHLRARKLRLRECLDAGQYWWFNRSAGQPCLIEVAYGLIAASLAELTHGLVYSGDGAWDYELFPAEPEDFLRWYFRPELAISGESRNWAESCIDSLRFDLAT